jgi:hypothetical protein
MADDERPDARDEPRDEQVAQWLAVAALDDVTRRRLVSNALRDADTNAAPAPARPSRAWRWVAAAAVLLVVLVGGLVVLTARGGDDTPVASREEIRVLPPEATGSTRDVGDFGDLDVPANLAALRAALAQSESGSSAPQVAGDASSVPAGEREWKIADGQGELRLCGLTLPDGATAVAQGTGTVDGRKATVVLVEAADGTRTVDAVLEAPCEVRHLP